ncbi:MAG: exo-alpha-sialidase [Verrucomicrobia bacterium]|nr:exo-alpha-sialidase [Verrucomicrobiota bacterium]
MKPIRLASFLPLALALSSPAQAAEPLPPWAGRSPAGEVVRVAVAPPANPRFEHLAWPKAVRTADGTIVLGFLAGTHHGSESCPAVAVSTDGGRTFSAPQVLKEFGPGKEYGNSGNMALGVAHDGAVLLLAHGHSKDSNHIYGWRSADQGRTWQPVDTSKLGPNKTGSSTGTIVQLPGRRLMVTGHYREGSKPHRLGIWQAVSADDGLSWGEPQMVNNLNAGEPVLVRHDNRLLVFIRGRGPAAARQFVSVSDDWGQTWVTDLLNLGPIQKHASSLAHPFAMVNPHNPAELLAVTFERPLPGAAQLWRAPAKTLAFKHDRTLVELPKFAGDNHTDFGYAWLLPLEGRRALVFYYHGLGRGPCPIWVLETSI